MSRENRVLRYGAFEPVRGLEHFFDVADRTRTYQNDRVALKRVVVQWHRYLAAFFVPAIQPLEAEVAVLSKRLKSLYVELREFPMPSALRTDEDGPKAVPKHLRTEIPETRAMLDEISNLKATRNKLYGEIRAATELWRNNFDSDEENMLEQLAEATLTFVLTNVDMNGRAFSGKALAETLLAEFREAQRTGVWPKRPEEPTKSKKGKSRKSENGAKEKDKDKLYFLNRCLKRDVLGPNVRGPKVKTPLRDKLLEGLSPGDPMDPFKARLMVDRFETEEAAKAYVRSGVTAGGRSIADAAYAAAIKSTPWPQFKDRSKPLRVGPLPFSKPVPVDVLFSANNNLPVQVRIDGPMRRRRMNKAKLAALPNGSVCESHRGRKLAVATIRLDANREIEVPFVMHRDFPSDATVSHVYVTMTRVGLKRTYNIHFTCESEEILYKAPTSHVSGVPVNDGRRLAINLGFRRHDCGGTKTWDGKITQPGDIRIATMWDGYQTFEVVVPQKMLDSQEHQERLLSHADLHFDDARTVLIKELRALGIGDLRKAGVELPHWVDTTTISKWRSHGRLAIVAREMASSWSSPERIRGFWFKWKSDSHLKTGHGSFFDSFENVSSWLLAQGVESRQERLVIYLDFWRRKDEHLIQWARDTEQKRVRARKELYRRVAAWISASYSKVVIEDWDKSVTAQRNDLTEVTKKNDAVNRQRQSVGISVFTTALKNKLGDRLALQNPANITTTHVACGGVDNSRGATIIMRCTTCGVGYDQDVNAARNLWGCEQSNDDENHGGARNDVSSVAAE